MKSVVLRWVLLGLMLAGLQSLLVSCQDAKGGGDNVSVISDNNCLRIASDELLTEGVKFVIKDYEHVNAGIENGVITLTGTVEKHRLPGLMMGLKSLRATRIVNHLDVK
jgi:hypothetical protein